jgi:hypothetical protein
LFPAVIAIWVGTSEVATALKVTENPTPDAMSDWAPAAAPRVQRADAKPLTSVTTDVGDAAPLLGDGVKAICRPATPFNEPST